MGGITDLIVWREAADLVANVSALCQQFRGPSAAKAADQLLRAAESITANIAEAYGRGVRPEGLQFLRFAKGSAEEVESHLHTSVRTKRVAGPLVLPVVDQTRRVQYLLRRFAESVERRIAANDGARKRTSPQSRQVPQEPQSPHYVSRMLASRFDVGSLVCHTIEAGLQRLDGGAMFGVVPKPLWERRIPADERNRIPLQMRCLLIEHPDGLVLIDTGAGNKDDGKFKEIYGLENDGDPGPTALEDGIREAGHDPRDVKWVINTHLHFDHAGGNTVRRADGSIAPSFPGATYVVQQGEREFATSPNERIRASYLQANYQPITDAGLFRLIEGEAVILPGIRALPTPGHVPFHQSLLIESGGETACFLGDLVPTSAHLPAPWIMGYDLEPLVTLETKKRVLTRAAAENWLLLFEHDPTIGRGRVATDHKKGWGPLLPDS